MHDVFNRKTPNFYHNAILLIEAIDLLPVIYLPGDLYAQKWPSSGPLYMSDT